MRRSKNQKEMNIEKRLKKHLDKKRFARVSRSISKNRLEISRGFILDYSDELILLQGTDDFQIQGFVVFEKAAIKEIRYNKNDKYYDKILDWEGIKKELGILTKVNISSWKKLFKSLKKKNKNVIIECEHPKIDQFIIGEILEVGKKKLSILYFNAAGVWDEKPTKVKYKDITKVMYDDPYVEVFSKYTRERGS